jgi:hypothetical protein
VKLLRAARTAPSDQLNVAGRGRLVGEM